MTLSKEQLAQCRAEFEEAWSLSPSFKSTKELSFHHFQAAWRPRLGVDDIESILSEYYDMEARANPFAAQAIHRALGGGEKDE